MFHFGTSFLTLSRSICDSCAEARALIVLAVVQPVVGVLVGIEQHVVADIVRPPLEGRFEYVDAERRLRIIGPRCCAQANAEEKAKRRRDGPVKLAVPRSCSNPFSPPVSTTSLPEFLEGSMRLRTNRVECRMHSQGADQYRRWGIRGSRLPQCTGELQQAPPAGRTAKTEGEIKRATKQGFCALRRRGRTATHAIRHMNGDK